MALEENFKKVCAWELIRLKGNCPSGYDCRTRHPQGLVILSAGSAAKERGRFLKCLNSKGRNEGKCSFTRRM
jgi:hypothetical protein